MKFHNHRCLATSLALLITVAVPATSLAVSVTADPPPVTAGLFVKLNGNNLSSAGALSIWQDQANDGNAGTFQNFVQASSGNQPSAVLNNLMPNGLEANVVNFVRGTITNNTSFIAASSDYLQSAAGGANASTSAGADSAYNVNQLAYFTVFQSTLGNATASGNVRQQLQSVISGDYSASTQIWNTGTHSSGYDSNGNAIAANLTPDLYNGVRNNLGSQIGTGVGDAVQSRWFIAATSFDTVSGDVRQVFYDQLGNVTDRSFSIAPDVFGSGLTGHTMSWMGAASTSTNSGSAMLGNIAEVLIYNQQLGTFDANKVINYLNDKYFGAGTVMPIPEPNSLILAGIGLAGAISCFYRRRPKVA